MDASNCFSSDSDQEETKTSENSPTDERNSPKEEKESSRSDQVNSSREHQKDRVGNVAMQKEGKLGCIDRWNVMFPKRLLRWGYCKAQKESCFKDSTRLPRYRKDYWRNCGGQQCRCRCLVTPRRARKGSTIRYNPDTHWSAALYWGLNKLEYTAKVLWISTETTRRDLDTLATHNKHAFLCKTPVLTANKCEQVQFYFPNII